MSAEKILITGASGFFGASALEHFQSKGKNIIGTTRNAETEIAKKLKLKKLDTSIFKDTVRFISDELPKTIFHFSGIAKPREIDANPEQARVANIDSVMNLINAILVARDKNPGYDPVIIVAGSVEQFGDPLYSGQVFDESSMRKPVNLYGSQKEEMSVMALNLFNTYNIKGYVVIQGQTSGTSKSGEISQSDGYLITEIASQIVKIENSSSNEREFVTGETSQKRNIANIKDVVEAYDVLSREAFSKAAPEVGEYIVCANESIPLDDVLQFMVQNSTIANLKRIVDRKRGFGVAVDRFYSHKKLSDVTGWEPKIGAEETVVEVLNRRRKQ